MIPKPDSVKCGGLEYRLLWIDDNSFHEDYRGQTSGDDLEIRVNARNLPIVQRLALLHELVHVASDVSLAGDARLSEGQVKLVAHNLFDILTRNPHVAAFILDQTDSPST